MSFNRIDECVPNALDTCGDGTIESKRFQDNDDKDTDSELFLMVINPDTRHGFDYQHIGKGIVLARVRKGGEELHWCMPLS